ncbi:alpha/beta fold hydrolase [Parasphingorhabdus halotolerans]|uniref:Alpha/beta hydrolase n=1 Tax=Parasphingorhabdus halotolerans TaxID=2725558 RepID=A0A6H2DL46_9SPHN|nr:alpha/beta hydrolase [Parasphingorhabdus halotolerans]QJB68675.1 alpha/beta hydrolase [Parasphingorhabdus halotolerans]
MKKLIRILLILLAVLIAAFFIFRTPDTDRAEMIAKYSNSASQFVDDGAGGTIHYRDEGNKAGIPLLLIHGSNGHLQTWEPLVKLLGDKYRLISLDLPGHGLTGPHGADDYSADANIASATKVLDTVGVDKAYWVGNSMGGWLTWRAGLSVPDRTLGLVLIDASGAQVDEKVKPYLGARLAQTSIGQWVMPHITPKSLIKSSLEQNYAKPELITDELVTRYWEMLRFPGNRQAAVLRMNTKREPEKWAEVGNLKMPVLLLWGEQDTVIPLSHAKAFEAAISGSTLITYPDAGHLPMEETPEQVARDIDAWITGVTNAAE